MSSGVKSSVLKRRRRRCSMRAIPSFLRTAPWAYWLRRCRSTSSRAYSIQRRRPSAAGAFVLYDEHLVLAHPNLISGISGLQDGQVLPTLDQINDPLVTAFDRRDTQNRRDRLLEEATGIRMVETPAANWAVVSSDIDRFGTIPWRIVVGFPAADFEGEFRRLRWAAIAGLGVLVIALILAYLLARYLSAPIDRLAVAAERVRELSLKNVSRSKPVCFAKSPRHQKPSIQ